MAVQEDANETKGGGSKPTEEAAPEAKGDGERPPAMGDPLEPPPGSLVRPDEVYDVAPVGASSPGQLGTRRFVYAAYFAAAIAIAFLLSKAVDGAWLKLQTYKPAIGEPRDEVVVPASAVVGALVAVYYWNRTRARQLAEEVATEMSKVTWPTRTEVTNGTVVVIVTTVVSTVFFALMDKFWGFVTNLVYGGS